MSLNEFSEKQKAILEELQRRKSIREETDIKLHPKKKQPMSVEEYTRRLNSQLNDVNKISEAKRKARIEEQIQAWHLRVGERFANATVTDARNRQIINSRVERIREGKFMHRNSLILIGDLGVGKTWMGHAYIEALIREGLLQNGEVCMGTEISILAPVADAGFNQPEELKRLLNPGYKVYFIDEVGRAAIRNAANRHAVWYALVNHAYINHIPIILTTNCGTAPMDYVNPTTNERSRTSELEAWIGDASLDRLRYMAGDDGVIIPSTENQRPQANKYFDQAGNSKK